MVQYWLDMQWSLLLITIGQVTEKIQNTEERVNAKLK
jgi:hypothetical protein